MAKIERMKPSLIWQVERMKNAVDVDALVETRLPEQIEADEAAAAAAAAAAAQQAKVEARAEAEAETEAQAQ
eukprot:1297133-Prymnesium_polylepis.1